MGKNAFANKKELLRDKMKCHYEEKNCQMFHMECSSILIRNIDIAIQDKNTLHTFKIWIWWIMMMVSWKEHRTNEDILSMVREKRFMVSTIRNRHKNWLV